MERNWAKFLIKWFAGWAVFWCALGLYLSEADADDLLQLRDVGVHVKRFTHEGRDPNVPLPPTGQLDAVIDTDIANVVYWNNRIHSLQDANGFALVGLNYQFGVRMSETVDLQYEHCSKHLLDGRASPGGLGYPLEDSVGIYLHVYTNKKPKEVIF